MFLLQKGYVENIGITKGIDLLELKMQNLKKYAFRRSNFVEKQINDYLMRFVAAFLKNA